jgi:hypothetical protein
MLICEVRAFNKHVAIKWMPCPASTGNILVACVARCDLGVLLDVTESMLEPMFKDTGNEAILLGGQDGTC